MMLTIGHLYPEKMNIYGDIGNIIALKKRSEWRGFAVNILNISEKNMLKPGIIDIYFMGGGQDQDQIEVYKDLIQNKKKVLQRDIKDGAVVLAICGGYQLLGEYFTMGDGRRAEGLRIVPIETIAPSTKVAQRCIGNIITNLQPTDEIARSGKSTLVGFENHSGRTRFKSDKLIPLGDVLVGTGDNENAKHEGVRFKNIFGTYMHGPFLPKNPHIADEIIKLAMERKYKNKVKLKKLDDTIEWNAHNAVINKFSK
ncbi:glutamine amidotransferase [Candidatus Dojkabacteria bacterium]|nr:glutamine amidotransferase [Candidatus Dojkabacteria bacterium]